MLAAALAGLVAVAGFAACALWPERWTVNAPLAHMLLGLGGGTPDAGAVDGRMRAPDGFSVGLWAVDVPGVRWLRVTPGGDLLASQPRDGRVWLLERDRDGDGRSDGRRVLLEGLNRPHGLDLREGWLYVAETDAVLRVAFDADAARVEGELERVVTGLPAGGNHWTRTLRFGPDGWMYVSVGSSCNVCLEDDERRAALLRFRPDGSRGEIFARGLRNTVGFDWQPGTGRLYGTDNGRDLLGDGFPPCELNHIERGAFYGWPFANGDRVPDPDLGSGREDAIARSRPPAFAFPAHNAPLGITFLRGPEAPAGYRGAALVALHGSWNRTRKDGYEVVSLHWDGDGRIASRPFLTGFLEEEDVIGRPVDVAQGPDGDVFVSDDYAGVVWRVVRGDEAGGEGSLAALRPDGEAGRSALASMSAEERRRRVRRGRALWQEHGCAECHEAGSAAPGVVVEPLRNLGARYGPDELIALLRTPPPPMPVPELADGERRDLAVYLLEGRP